MMVENKRGYCWQRDKGISIWNACEVLPPPFVERVHSYLPSDLHALYAGAVG